MFERRLHVGLAFLLACTVTACQERAEQQEPSPRCSTWGQDVARIEERMAAQETAWNAGDLEGFMEPYWKSDSLLFVGSRGPSFGWDTTLANYRKSYPDAAAMGKLTFGVEGIEPAGPHHALMLGSWRLDRTGEFEPLSGWFSLVWARRDDDWVIIRDHSS